MDDDGDDELAQVIPLPRPFAYNTREAKLDEECVVRTSREPRPCSHARSFVDRAARTVTCRACGVALDPIDVLDAIARDRESIVSRGMMLRRQVDDLAKQVATLERVERNAKSRIRTARKRSAISPAEVEAAARHMADANYLAVGRSWETISEEQRARLREQVRPALEAFVAYEEPDDADVSGVETA